MMMHQALEGTPIAADTTAWDAAMLRYRMAFHRARNEWRAYCEIPHDHEDRKVLEGLCGLSADEEDEAEKALLEMPAPHLAALRWKLDNVITFDDADDDDEFMAAWARRRVAQTIADYKRLLPDASAGS